VQPRLSAPLINISESPQEGVDTISATTSETSDAARENSEHAKPADATAVSQELVRDVKTRLKSMLACQYSFGSTIGAPVVFYIGSFIYTVLEIRSLLGDNASTNPLQPVMTSLRFLRHPFSMLL
jgi:hypothetical protein